MITTVKKLSSNLTLFFFAFSMFVISPAIADMKNDKPDEEKKEEITFRFENEVLLNFFDANRELSELNKETQERISLAAQAENLTLERFNQIVNANRIGALQGGMFTDEEVQSFVNLGPQITQIQREQQTQIQEKLQEKGFTSESYQDVLNEYRTDTNLQAHVRELLRERRKQEILEERRREAEEKAAQEAGE
jgi:hypothetical protein